MKRKLHNLKWWFIREICKILFKPIVIEQRFLRYTDNLLKSGYQKYQSSQYCNEGRLYDFRYGAVFRYIYLGDYTYILARGNKYIMKFFNVEQKIKEEEMSHTDLMVLMENKKRKKKLKLFP